MNQILKSSTRAKKVKNLSIVDLAYPQPLVRELHEEVAALRRESFRYHNFNINTNILRKPAEYDMLVGIGPDVCNTLTHNYPDTVNLIKALFPKLDRSIKTSCIYCANHKMELPKHGPEGTKCFYRRPAHLLTPAQATGRARVDSKRTESVRLCAGPECAGHGETGPLKQFSGCKVVYYCSVACQRSHWKNGHREACQAMRENMMAAQGN